jgi:predicted dehydrogenase
MKSSSINRRSFLIAGTMALATAPALAASKSLFKTRYRSPLEKLNIGSIGAGGQAAYDLSQCEGENIVALCDVDWDRAAKSFEKYPKAQKYRDFRQMLDKEKTLDAVIVAIPDHMHTLAALWAMERGLHVYVQKPLTRTVYEARVLKEAAQKYQVITQMGNQGNAGEGVRRFCEIVWSGIIGHIREVHCWTDRPIWPQGIKEPLPAEPIPATMDWDLWCGTAQPCPYNSKIAPFNWRGWHEFGTGAMGDMACHVLNPVNRALQLSLTGPTSVECTRIEGKNSLTFPTQSILKYEFPARGPMPPLTLYWYEGGPKPAHPPGVPPETKLGDDDNGTLLYGDQGVLTTGVFGDGTRLLPLEKMKDFKMPEKRLARSVGNYQEWIEACKGGPGTLSNFDYAGPFTEYVLLGVVAQRASGKLIWNHDKMEFSGNREASQFLKPHYRKGWNFKEWKL